MMKHKRKACRYCQNIMPRPSEFKYRVCSEECFKRYKLQRKQEEIERQNNPDTGSYYDNYVDGRGF